MAEGSMKVTKIYTPEDKAKQAESLLRVAAYCRVSTKSDEQHLIYETQVAVYSEKIRVEPGWTMAGIYADRGISGTQAERRPQFLQMVRDCEDGKIDAIICKSVSRFSRNTLDAVNYMTLSTTSNSERTAGRRGSTAGLRLLGRMSWTTAP